LVTKKKFLKRRSRAKKPDRFLSLYRLSKFLNAKFGSRDSVDLSTLAFFIPPVLEYSFSKEGSAELSNAKPDWANEGKRLQRELLEDLTPILKAARKNDDLSVGHGLRMLLKKIDNLQLQSRLILETGTPQVVSYKSDPKDPSRGTPKGQQRQTLESILAEDDSVRRLRGSEKMLPNPAVRHLGPERRILKIGGAKWIIRRKFDNPRCAREALYGIISNALETGEFSRLKRCNECQRFFIGEDPRQEYCKPKCRDEHHDRDAVNRVRRSRRKKQRALLDS